ncbi:UDP-N-acetylmuramoyl-tripeptide--D-alanyl-D-alanine ligase [bacterium HR40]|nr:UDP-N-acetylmuramoyl-tripeptide--D-alanyl-D-alanine ligase [bacterium HR40]
MSLWTAQEVLLATEGRGPSGWQATGVSIDSRTLEPGDLFVALRGPRHDGHAFLADAFARGAAAAIVATDAAIPELGPCIGVADTQRALVDLGQFARARSRARIVAVTGSVGKTGTKEALRHVLAREGRTHASAASHNNHWGVPLSLARLPADCRFAVFELGMNRPGEIRALVAQVRPQVAIVTWIAPAHIGFFPDETAIARAKAEIFACTPPPQVAVLPADNPHFPLLRRIAEEVGVPRILVFGTTAEADASLLAADIGPAGSSVEARILGVPIRYGLSVPGRHWVMNSLAVLAACAALGVDPERAAAALGDFALPRGRGTRRSIRLAGGGVATVVDDSYNANPASMRAAIATLALYPGRRIAVLGEMAELGERTGELHAALATELVAAGVARVFVCGEAMRHLWQALPVELRGAWTASAEDLLEPVRAELAAGDVILVKGSNASGMGRIVDALGEQAVAREDV